MKIKRANIPNESKSSNTVDGEGQVFRTKVKAVKVSKEQMAKE